MMTYNTCFELFLSFFFISPPPLMLCLRTWHLLTFCCTTIEAFISLKRENLNSTSSRLETNGSYNIIKLWFFSSENFLSFTPHNFISTWSQTYTHTHKRSQVLIHKVKVNYILQWTTSHEWGFIMLSLFFLP